MDPERHPIWTIPRGEITTFFTVLMIAGYSFVVFHEYHLNGNQTVSNIIRELIANAGSVTAGSAGIAIAASETTRGIMVIASFLREKLLEPQRKRYREQGLEQGLEQGRQEMATHWNEWNQRRLTAQENGEEFDEPPPTQEQTTTAAPGTEES